MDLVEDVRVASAGVEMRARPRREWIGGIHLKTSLGPKPEQTTSLRDQALVRRRSRSTAGKPARRHPQAVVCSRTSHSATSKEPENDPCVPNVTLYVPVTLVELSFDTVMLPAVAST